MPFDKSLMTNLIALLLALLGFLLPGNGGDLLLSAGLFAASGAFTNWLALHMLFEKVPGFYGSGVIPARFDEFKTGIRDLIMGEFFNPENVRQFLSGLASDQDRESLVAGVVDRVDLSRAFDALIEVIMQSSFAGMLGMLGGPKALQPLREPFMQRMREFLLDLGQDPGLVEESGNDTVAKMLDRVEHIVDRRLDELTPQLVKEIMQRMIRRHLGWLVVWGGVVGGLIGFLVELLL